MTQKILIIGGAGYIGGLTTDYLLRDGFEVTVYDNLLYEERYLKPVSFVHGDIRETEKIAKLSEKFDIIIILAGLVGDQACAVDPIITEAVNLTSVEKLCSAISKDKHIIFMSTCSVYGVGEGILNENSPTNSLSVYATTKLEAEKYVSQRNGTIFRLGTVFGLGDNYSRIRMDLVANVLTMRALRNGEITINGGDQWRPIISVIDIAEYLVEACKKKIPGTYVISKENVTIKDLGERIVKLIPKTKIIYRDIPFEDNRNYKVDNSQSLSAFNYKPKVSLEDEMRRMMLLFTENRIKDPNDKTYNNGAFINKLKESGTFL